MSRASNRNQNNIRAGLFVTASLVAMLGVAVFLSDSVAGLLREESSYVAHFDVTGGVSNMQTGADVRLGGVSVGTVTGVELTSPTAGDTSDESVVVEVAFEVDRRFALRDGVAIRVGTPLVGSDVWVDITGLGTGEIIQPGQIIRVRTGASMIAQLLGPDAADNVQSILASVAEIADAVNGGDPDAEFRLAAFLATLDEGVTGFSDMGVDARDLVRSIKDDSWPGWRDSIDTTMDRLPAISADAEATMARSREFTTWLRDFTEEHDGSLSTTVTNIEAISAKVRDETLPLVEDQVAALRPTIRSAGRLMDRLEGAVDQWDGDVTETLVNARITSQRIALLSEELRRSPWKILYRPDMAEYENELLYEAARGLAYAADSLRVATASAERILDEAGPAFEDDPELARRIRENIATPLRNYEEAQQRMLEVLLEHSGAE